MFHVEPLLPTQPEEIADLANMVSTPIALGERLFSRYDFRPYLERRAIDIAQPDVRTLSCRLPSYAMQMSGLTTRAGCDTGRALWRDQRAAPACVVHGDV